MDNIKEGWIDDEGADWYLRLIYNKLLRDVGKKELYCFGCHKELPFEEWKRGGQGYCKTCFAEVVKETMWSDKMWKCQFCEHMNPNEKAVCEVCHSER